MIKCKIWKRLVTIITACQALSFTLLPPMGIVTAQARNQGEKALANKGISNDKKGLHIARKLNLNVKSSILMEATTGEILEDFNSDKPFSPASMTKMMVQYILSEKVKQGDLSWDDEVVATKNASATGGSHIFLVEGDKHTVRDLYIAMVIGSANDATVALAEHIAGSEEEFVKSMNKTAKDLGMTKTHYINATGLARKDMPEQFRPKSEKETVMSAKDTAKLVHAIVTNHPDFHHFSKVQSFKFRKRDKDEIKNLNWMLEANKDNVYLKRFAYPGLDGMKTGFTDEAKYCFAGTAVQGNMRLISVVMGAASKETRFEETAKLLNYGFNKFEVKHEIAPKKVVTGVERVRVKKGVTKEVPVVVETGISFVIPKGTKMEGKITRRVNLKSVSELVAPIQKGQRIGTITLTYKDKGIEQKKMVNLIASEKVEKGSWLRLFLRSISEFFINLFDSIKNLF